MPDILAILVQARALIARPENWCIKVFNQIKFGAYPSYTSYVSYCSRGAIFEVLGIKNPLGDMKDDNPYCYELIKHVPDPYPLARDAGDSVAHYNNSHTHAEVLLIFDQAIARLRAEKGVAELKNTISRMLETV